MPYELPDRLQKARCRKMMKANGLAEESFVPERLITAFEEGSEEPKAGALYLLCRALGCSADYLLGLDKNWKRGNGAG